MTLDENDGSDMDLDSDTSPEIYHSSTVTTYNQCSKPPVSQDSNKDKDGLNQSLDKDKRSGSRPCSPQRSGEGSLQPSNHGNGRIGNTRTKNHISVSISKCLSCTATTAPFILTYKNLKTSLFHFTETATNLLPEPLSPLSTPSLTASRSQQSSTNGFSLKPSMNTRINVSNGPSPLAKREKIKFELKKSTTGYKNKLISHSDKQSINFVTSIKNISDTKRNRNDNLMKE